MQQHHMPPHHHHHVRAVDGSHCCFAAHGAGATTTDTPIAPCMPNNTCLLQARGACSLFVVFSFARAGTMLRRWCVINIYVVRYSRVYLVGRLEKQPYIQTHICHTPCLRHAGWLSCWQGGCEEASGGQVTTRGELWLLLVAVTCVRLEHIHTRCARFALRFVNG